MNRIDFSNLGGIPIDQDSLAFMQASYRDAFAALATLCGNKTILTGVIVTGLTASSGWISYNGELIPFVGGGVSTDVVIEETAAALTFEDQSTHDVEFTKVARFGTPGTFPFTDLKRLNTIQEMWLPGDLKQVDCNGAYIAANFDATGLGINERKGWAVCNGSNGTKDRGGRVSVGYSVVAIDPGDNVWDAVYNTIGAPGGVKKVLLDHSEIPPLDITAPLALDSTTGGSNVYGRGGLFGNNGNISYVNNSQQAHENRQPFIVTLFIQKL